MSSQAERIKAFKLAQHARLQKQDEEEQWISSEELCTEGSSDEEMHTSSPKSSHRKQKRNPRTEKRGISPLAQPPKPETESTSTYQRDSKYLLPDVHACSKTTDIRRNSGIDQPDVLKLKSEAGELRVGVIDSKVEKLDLGASAHSSTTRDSSQDSEQSDEDSEIEKMIQWRPKRGSIKLPDFPEGVEERPSTLKHDIFKADAFYTEMVTKVNSIKQTFKRSKYTLSEAGNSIGNTQSLDSPQPKRKRDPAVHSLFEEVSNLEIEIAEKTDLFEATKKERILIQEEMCNAISQTEISPADTKNSQVFLQLCNFEKTDYEAQEIAEQIANNESSEQQQRRQKKSEKTERNFITRNIELSKQRLMAQFSLTDEEKVRLESLLLENDSEENSTDSTTNDSSTMVLKGPPENHLDDEIFQETESSEEKNEDNINLNYFKLQGEEVTTIEDLDCKLHEILNSYDENDRNVNQTLITTKDGEDVLEAADKEGRYWKHHQFQKRLELIEKDLADIAAKDAEEQEKLEAKNLELEKNHELETEEEEATDNTDEDK